MKIIVNSNYNQLNAEEQKKLCSELGSFLAQIYIEQQKVTKFDTEGQAVKLKLNINNNDKTTNETQVSKNTNRSKES